MVRDAEAHAEEAHTLRELADAKNQGENLVYQTEKALKENRDALDESVAGTIEGRIMELNEALKGSDLAEVQAKTAALVEASHALAEAVYAKANEASSQQAGDGNGASADEHEVVEDADYEVVDEVMTEPDDRRRAAHRRAGGRAGRASRRPPARRGRLRQLQEARRARPGEPRRARARAARPRAPARARQPGEGAEGGDRARRGLARGGRSPRPSGAPRCARRARASWRSTPTARSTRTCTRRC